MNSRQERLLRAIVESFFQTASPVGSKYIFDTYHLKVSPATIRNDMAQLEAEGLIYQPHTSAGRVPTGKAYRNFVDQLAIEKDVTNQVKRDIKNVSDQYYLKRLKERLYDLVAILAQVTGNISFATLPDKKRVFYIGISRVLREPEFTTSPERASQVVEVLEHQLYQLLEEIRVSDDMVVLIGEENLLPAMHSCSLLATRYHEKSYEGVMGVIGPTRMDYAYNITALREVASMFY